MEDGRSIYAPKPGPIITPPPTTTTLSFSVYNAVQRVVGPHDDDGGHRRQTMMYLWARTMRRKGSEASLAKLVEAHGWPKSTFTAQVNDGFDLLAIILQAATDGAREACLSPPPPAA